MMDKLQLLEEYSMLKRIIDKNLEKKCSVEATIDKQREKLREVEVLLEKTKATPMYLTHG
jgi:hypothetical protein